MYWGFFSHCRVAVIYNEFYDSKLFHEVECLFVCLCVQQVVPSHIFFCAIAFLTRQSIH